MFVTINSYDYTFLCDTKYSDDYISLFVTTNSYDYALRFVTKNSDDIPYT